MPYIPRSIKVKKENGEDVILKDWEFFQLSTPLVLLGDPGVGKSEVVRQYAKQNNSKIIIASTLDSLNTFPNVASTISIVIDGVDEITAYGDGAPINKILSKIPDANSNFILTCRGADWQSALNGTVMSQKWQNTPTVGKLQPLSVDEIEQFVDSTSTKIKGKIFVEEARNRDVLELARNPQMLILLLKNVETQGWPDSKFTLFDIACRALTSESNPLHQSLDKMRPSVDSILETGGFIFAQLLLSGRSGIKHDGADIQGLVRPSELLSDSYSEILIKKTLGTMLFKVFENDTLQPCHRTVAEFLAAKWLAGEIRNKLSFRRLEKLLYSENFVVPTSLRGLHAWLANHSKEHQQSLVSRDPYGFLRYGDADILTTPQIRYLFESLEKFADFDPYFRSEDWDASFSNSLARVELKDDFIKLIRKAPFQLSHLMLQVIQGSELSKLLQPVLGEIVTDPKASVSEKYAAVDALTQIGSRRILKDAVPELLSAKKIDSLRVALHIIESEVDSFSGEIIAEAILSVGDPDIRHNFAGLGYKLESKLNNQQRSKVLNVLIDAIENEKKALASDGNRRARRRANYHRKFKDVESWILRLVKERLSSDEKVTAKQLWAWLKHIDKGGFFKSEWDKFNVEYFNKNASLRQQVQTVAFDEATTLDDMWLLLWDFRDTAHGLMLGKDDLIYHMERFAKQRKGNDWAKRWQNLARWAKGGDANADAYIYAKKQASLVSELAPLIAEIEQPPARDWVAEDKERNRKWELKKEEDKKKRHKSYADIREDLKSGKSLGALNQVASVLAGYYPEIEEVHYRDRLKNLVGEDLIDDALEGILNAAQRNDIPTVRQMISLRVKDNKSYYFEPILVVNASLVLRATGKLPEFSPEVAAATLAARELGIFGGDEKIDIPDPQETLENIVFTEDASAEKYLRDFFEPSLEAGIETVSRLHDLERYGGKAKVLGKLALDWLEKYQLLAKSSLRELLQAAISFSERRSVVDIVRAKITAGAWQDGSHQSLWMGAAFLVDFEMQKESIAKFVDADSRNLTSIRELIFIERKVNTYWPKLDAAQNYFLLERVLSLPEVNQSKEDDEDSNGTGFSGGDFYWSINQFINARIELLAADFSHEATQYLNLLIANPKINRYKDFVKHALAQQLRGVAESVRKSISFTGVRDVLLRSEPGNSEDLQAVIIDELEILQRRIKDSANNSMLPFWNNNIPHDENYCRSRIVDQLEQALAKYNIRCYIESAMPAGNRCDILNTHGQMNLPVEVKGQWHADVWKAANDQLIKYTREYRTDGRGIYLVIWFGDVKPKNPPKISGVVAPISARDMKSILEKTHIGLSPKTQIFVLDVSKHPSKKVKTKSKKSTKKRKPG